MLLCFLVTKLQIYLNSPCKISKMKDCLAVNFLLAILPYDRAGKVQYSVLYNMVVHKNMDFRKSLGLIFICVRNVIRSKKKTFKTIFDHSFTLA